ncbi:nucleotidyltransferase domain-containing protein [Candidatus Poribacteria bacterium]|nr:nucleotidyltransferase domain-containing protein [Candidatus Poribacteria bacterium]
MTQPQIYQYTVKNMELSEREIREEIVKRIQKAAHPRKIVLFGSRARGDAEPDSDYDLLVVKDEIKSRRDESHQIRMALMALPIFVDVLLRRTDEDNGKQQLHIGIQKSLAEEGIILYERGA